MNTELKDSATRKLARVTTVDDVIEHGNADALEIAVIGGWNVVIKTGEFAKGDHVVFFEIDSALPLDDPRFEFLGARSSKIWHEKPHHILKTARLRGVVSQGLLLPASIFPEISEDPFWYESIGVKKYEPVLPAQLAGQMEGAFYTREDFRKTDAERVQNLSKVWDYIQKENWVATEKLDGSSASVIVNEDGSTRLFSRNWELVATPELTLAQVVNKMDLTGLEGYQFQGELIGPGIQGNKLQLSAPEVRVFGVFKDFKFVPREDWPDSLKSISVPVLDIKLPETISEAVSLVDGIKSTVNPKVLAEGVVFTSGKTLPFLGERSVFKVISNKWLLKAK